MSPPSPSIFQRSNARKNNSIAPDFLRRVAGAFRAASVISRVVVFRRGSPGSQFPPSKARRLHPRHALPPSLSPLPGTQRSRGVFRCYSTKGRARRTRLTTKDPLAPRERKGLSSSRYILLIRVALGNRGASKRVQ